MQSYNYRSVKALAEYRYPQINDSKNNHLAPGQVWRHGWGDPAPARPMLPRRKQGSNDRAPDDSRAA
ncbi:MAG TPA: hypothetical protein VJQ79_08725 [Acidimicrobiia bacterium]|nr:hypothetical protein [Acidimicrobiia bacterium]